MTTAESVTLASGLRLSCAEHGARSPVTVVLWPGPTDSWRSYAPVLDRLPPEVRAIAVSPRGHGDSDKPPAGYRIEDFAQDAIELLDALEIDRAVLAGHSGSCLVARRVALDHPARVAGLVLEASPTSLRRDPDLERFVSEVIGALADPIDPEFARSFVADTSSDNVTPAALDELVDDVREVPARVWREMFSALLEYDDIGELGRIDAPTLLIWGDGDELVPRAMQDALVAAIPNAGLTVYAGAGHTPRWEDPQRFADELARFVDQLPVADRQVGSTPTRGVGPGPG